MKIIIDDKTYTLIPLANEPKPDYTAVTDKLQYALDMCMDKLHDLDQRLALEMKRNDELYKDAVARVNGLRADYLADKDAVSPARVDNLEERVEDAHETAAFANRKVVAWTDRVDVLEERLETVGDLSQHAMNKVVELSKRLDAVTHLYNTEGSAIIKRLEALEQRSQPTDKGVWVTTKTFWDACWSQVSVKGEPLEDLFERMAKQLGLEE